MRIERVLFLDFLNVKKREKHYFVESKESVVILVLA
jgi:hypothetical protein